MKRHFAEEEIQMTIKHIMKLSLSDSRVMLMKMRCFLPADWQN